MNRGGIVTGLIVKVAVFTLVGMGLLYFSLDYIAEFGIEIFGTWIIRSRVSVSSVDLDLFKGKATVEGITVRNPGEFSDGNVLELDSVTASLDLSSLTGKTTFVDRLILDGPKVSFERAEDQSSNVEEIKGKIDEWLDKRLKNNGTDNDSKRFRIRRLTVRNGSIAVKKTGSGDNVRSIRLPSLTLTNVGGSSGSSAIRLAKTVADTFSKAIIKTARGRGVESYLETVVQNKLLDPAKDFLKKVF